MQLKTNDRQTVRVVVALGINYTGPNAHEILRKCLNTLKKSRQTAPYHLVRITVWRPSSGPWSSPHRDLTDWWCCAPSLVPPSLQKSLDDATLGLLSLVECRPRDLHHSRLRLPVVWEGEKKEKEKGRTLSSQSPCSFRSQLSSPVSWVVRLVARQLHRHGREQHKPPVRVCNVRHSSFCRCVNVQPSKMLLCALILFRALFVHAALLCLKSHKCAYACVAPPRASWTWIVQRISAETFCKFNGMLRNQISPVFPLRFRSPSKPYEHTHTHTAYSFPLHLQRHPNNGLSDVLIWWGAALSGRSAGASGPHNNEPRDDFDILRNVMNEQSYLCLQSYRRPLFHCNIMTHNKM